MGLWSRIKAWFIDAPPGLIEPADEQDKAFKEAAQNPFTDTELKEAVERGELEVWPAMFIKSPEEYEEEGWDAERRGPKTPAEADAENRGEEI